MSSIIASDNFATTSIIDLLACNSAADINALPVPAVNTPTNFHGCQSFLPAPWLVSSVLTANSNDPINLIVVCHQAAILFDQYHFGNPLFTSRAINHLEDFAQWVWGVNKISKMRFTLDLTDPKISHYKKSQLQHCSIIFPSSVQNASTVNPIPYGVPPTFNNTTDAILLQLAKGISLQNNESQAMNEILTRQLDHTIKKDAKNKDRLKKLHPSVLKFIIFASSKDANTVPPNVTDACERFINLETEGLADLELNAQFKS
jgi:hypothetical protein